MIGRTIAHYRILEQLGSGGMGVVYRVEDTRLHRFVALKFQPQEFAKTPQARAKAAVGDTMGSREAYQDFLALWKKGDANIPVLKRAQAEYAKAR